MSDDEQKSNEQNSNQDSGFGTVKPLRKMIFHKGSSSRKSSNDENELKKE